MTRKWYAVRRGRSVGVFGTWKECSKAVAGVKGAVFKSFSERSLAQAFVDGKKLQDAPPLAGCCCVHTDGASAGNGRNGARAGIGVYWGTNDVRNVSEPLQESEPQTNQRAELKAAVRAVAQHEHFNGAQGLEVRTDSMYVINGVSKWMRGWLESGWVKGDGEPVKHADLWRTLHALTARLRVEWTHVKGHSGVPGNEAADRLATRGLTLPLIEAREATCVVRKTERTLLDVGLAKKQKS